MSSQIHNEWIAGVFAFAIMPTWTIMPFLAFTTMYQAQRKGIVRITPREIKADHSYLSARSGSIFYLTWSLFSMLVMLSGIIVNWIITGSLL